MAHIQKIKKYLFWPLAILGILGYAADYFTKMELPIAGFASFFAPFSFLLIVLAVLTIYSPHKIWKKLVILGVIAFSFLSIALDVDSAFIAVNVAAFLGILYFLLLQKTNNKLVIFGLGAGLVLTAMFLVFGVQLSHHFLDMNGTKAFALVMLGLFVMLAFPQTQLWKKVIVGLVLGVLLGFNLKDLDSVAFSEYLKILGSIFIDLIMMIVVPLIFFSLVSGINNVNDSKALGRIGTKSVLVYTSTAMLSVALGLVIANIVNPGIGMDLTAFQPTNGGGGTASSAHEMPAVLKILLNFIPHNALGAMSGAEGKPHMVQTVFFAIFVGVTLNIMGEQGKRLVDFTHSAAQLMFKMIGFIIRLSPLAVFGLMTWVTANLGIDAILKLARLVAATIGGMGIHYIILGLLILALGRLSPLPFYRKSIEYQTLAFSTSSSKATLATAMKVSEDKLGISKSSTSFILPLGAAINMDGTAIYLGLCSVFFAQGFGIDLDFHHYLLIVFAATVASMGAAGYPGGSIVMMSMVLDTIGVPTSAIPILLGVDRILDMFRTTINITSDVAILMIIDRSEGTFDEKRYFTPLAELDKLESKA